MLPTPEIPVFCANKYEFQNDTTSVEFIFTSSKGTVISNQIIKITRCLNFMNSVIDLLANSKKLGRDQLLSHVGLADGSIFLVSSISQVFYKEACWNTQAAVLCLKYLSQKLLAVGHPNG